MGIRSLISFGLLLIPIAITVGVLVGLDVYRSSTGGPPLFPPDTNTGGGGTGGIDPNDDSVKNEIYCDKAIGIHPASVGQEFTLNPNPWNWQQGEPGALCLHVDTNANGTYTSEAAAPPFWITWQYPQGEVRGSNVHAFPNAKYDTSGVLPVELSSLQGIKTTVEWHYSVGSTPGVGTNVASIEALPAAANIAFDMFIDTDKDNAKDATKAKFELMVWLGAFSPSYAQPVGMVNGPKATVVIQGITFTLYYGQNGNGQHVLTWFPATIVETLNDVDLKTFLDELQQVTDAAVQLPSASDYLGYISMGTEAYYAQSNLTFSVPSYSLEVTKS